MIKDLDADVVGVLESYARLPEIASGTGYPYYNTSLQILSKYPILEASGGDGLYAMLEVQPGYVIPFFNVHLDYVDWGPRKLAKGVPVDEVIANENEVRTSSLDRPAAAMSDLIEQGYPVFLTGDFNEPSSLDYTEEAVGTRKEITEPVAWPVSEKLFGMGFRDSYREINPDPVATPAVTQEKTGRESTTSTPPALGDPRQQADRGARRGGRRHRGVAVDIRPPRRALHLRRRPGRDADARRRRRSSRHRW